MWIGEGLLGPRRQFLMRQACRWAVVIMEPDDGLEPAGMFGATLFYGDSIITPAISVLLPPAGASSIGREHTSQGCRSRWSRWTYLLRYGVDRLRYGGRYGLFDQGQTLHLTSI